MGTKPFTDGNGALALRDLAVKSPARRYGRAGPRTPPVGRRIEPLGIHTGDSRGW